MTEDMLAVHRCTDLVGPGTVVVDLGACVGAFAFPCADRGARVLAVEPRVENALQLRKRTDVEVLLAGAGPDDGWCTVQVPPGAEATGAYIEPGHGPVPMLSLRTIVEAAGGHVDVLKCDIQGGEYELFDATDHATLARIAFAAIEFHVWTAGAEPRREGVGHIDLAPPMPEHAVVRLIEKLAHTHTVEQQGPADAGGTVYAWRRP